MKEELDKITLIRTITECELAYEEYMQKSRDLENLPLTAKSYYDKAQVYKFIMKSLKDLL